MRGTSTTAAVRDPATRASHSTVAGLVASQARVHPDRVAVVDGDRRLTYATLIDRVRRLASVLQGDGVGVGDRIALLSENRVEFLETVLAAAWLGAVVACQNWRLAPPELACCLDLIDPDRVVASERHAARSAGRQCFVFGPAWEARLQAAEPHPGPVELDPESPLLVLYTSGTTGLPKGAVLSHRCQVARNLVVRAELGLAPSDAFVAWSPMYHMGGLEYSLGTLMAGGTVVVVDGFDAERLADLVATESLGWLLLMPGMVGRFADLLERRGVVPRGVRVCGVMADLVPRADLGRITTLLRAPYVNSFGATETGNPPCSAGTIPIGVVPERLSKRQSVFCEVRLVDPDDRDVPDGEPGELCLRGPTLFSGYYEAPEVTAHDFRGGWFHMGDVFVRNPDGTLDFVDRRKYLIKSGGENVYPAEIERVLLQDPRVAEAAVVRRADPRWGEVPVAFVARRDASLTEADLYAACRAALAGYKQPRDIRFLDFDAFPRAASGKVQRHELERHLDRPGDPA